MRTTPPRHILVIRLSAIGDVIMASGLIPVLRRTYPDARLSWLTEDTTADLLRQHPRLDRVFVWPRQRWRTLRAQGQHRLWLTEAWELIGQLRSARHDLVLDLQGLMKSALWAVLSGGRPRIGLGSREGSAWLMTRVVDRRSDSPLIGKEYRKLASELGWAAQAFALDIVPSREDQLAAETLQRAHGMAENYVIIAPFTTRPQKHWFEARWVDLAHRLHNEWGLRVVMLGGPGDQAQAASITAQVPGGVVDLVGHTSLGACAALIARARLLIGVDTGLTHLGVAMKTPTLGLFGSTRPYLATGQASTRILYHPLSCSPCRRNPSCGGAFDCMRLTTVDEVLRAASALLAESS